MATTKTKKELKALLEVVLDRIDDAIEFVDEHAKEFAETADDLYFDQILCDAQDMVEGIVKNELKG